MSRPRDKHWASNRNSSDSWPAGFPSYPVLSCSSRVRCTLSSHRPSGMVRGIRDSSVEEEVLESKPVGARPHQDGAMSLAQPSRSCMVLFVGRGVYWTVVLPLVSAFQCLSHTLFASLCAHLASVVWGEELWRLFCHRAYIAILAPSRSILRCFVRSSVVRPLGVSQCTSTDNISQSGISHF